MAGLATGCPGAGWRELLKSIIIHSAGWLAGGMRVFFFGRVENENEGKCIVPVHPACALIGAAGLVCTMMCALLLYFGFCPATLAP